MLDSADASRLHPSEQALISAPPPPPQQWVLTFVSLSSRCTYLYHTHLAVIAAERIRNDMDLCSREQLPYGLAFWLVQSASFVDRMLLWGYAPRAARSSRR